MIHRQDDRTALDHSLAVKNAEAKEQLRDRA
jgi:hypothetical protein